LDGYQLGERSVAMPRGSKPGAPRRREIKALAAQLPAIIKELVRLATRAKNEATREHSRSAAIQ
jgi:hypothetical protein